VEQPSRDLDALRAVIAELVRRVDALERKFDGAVVAKAEAPPKAAPPAAVTPAAADTSAESVAAAQMNERQTAPPASHVAAPPPPPPAPHIPPRAPYPLVPLPAVRRAQPAPDDLESRIGSQWFNRIGITAVLIGVSYFLKYAFDNNWIGASGRVAIGLLAGIGLVLWSERFRSRGFRAFSYSLKAVGIGAMYLSLWAAFQLYHMIASGTAFFAMVLVTAATAVMAITQDAELLAAFALAGGFLTPIALSTGQNQEIALFSYVALLDFATLAFVIYKPWRRLLPMSFLGTLVLYVGWYAEYYSRMQLTTTLFFATLFFAIFALAPVLTNNAKSDSGASVATPLLLALLNAGVYFIQVYVMYETVDRPLLAWFALGLAGIYIGLARWTRYRNPQLDEFRSLQLIHLALAVGFITIAIPLRLEGHWITIGWFVEAAVLLWVADRIQSQTLLWFAVAALALGIVRLLTIDNFNTQVLIFNSRMLTYAIAIAVLGLVAWYGSKLPGENANLAVAISTMTLNALALIALSREVSDYFLHQRVPSTQLYPYARYGLTQRPSIAESFTYSALWMAYGAMLMIIGFWRRSALVRWQALFLIAATIVKVFVYDVSTLDKGYRILSFIVLGALLLGISYVYQRGWLQLSDGGARHNATQGRA
jgi:uncharacterized membrane protein